MLSGMLYLRRLIGHHSSPASAIALLALFVALSGVAVALPGKNGIDKNDPKRGSIGTRAIANNSIRTADIRTGAVRASDIGDGSVTGDDVSEGTLGKVPRATSADSAARAATATSAETAKTAGSAATAASAANAGALDGVSSTGYLRTSANRIRSAGNVNGLADYANNAPLVQLSNLARGTYAVTAKLTVNNDNITAENVTCALVKSAGTTILDSSLQTLGPFGGAGQQLDFAFTAEVAAGSAGTDDLYLRCTNALADNDADDLKIVAHLENN
jgi:hypothetical protein